MPAFNIKNFSELVSDQVTAMQARASKLVDFSIGSILRSLAESNAGVAMWIQQLIVKLLVTTRAATCSGEDLDSWMADFGFRRLSAVQAAGTVTFSRFTASHQACIPAGTKIMTSDGSQHYAVVADPELKAWDRAQSAYIIASDVSALAVPVRAETAGASGNAQAGMISVINGSIPYVDMVTNTAAFNNGKDAEPDEDFRARFVSWISSLSKATKAAVGYAVSTTQRGMSFTLTENMSYDGLPKPGYFYAVVDDGSGAPGHPFLDRVRERINQVRGFTVTFGVFGPEVIEAKVALHITTAPEAEHKAVTGLVEQALRDYICRQSLGQLLAYTQLIRVAYTASPFVLNVTSLTLNDKTSDLSASVKEVIRPGTITVL